MADRQTPDSSGSLSGSTQGAGISTQTSSATSGPSGSLPVDSAPDGGSTALSTITAADHEAALAAERRRRSGQERAHQKEVGSLRADLEALKAQIASLPISPTSTQGTARLRQLVTQLEDGHPITSDVIREVVLAVDAWSTYFNSQRQDEERRRTNASAVEDALDEVADLYSGVSIPRTALDLSSPDAVRMSAERFIARKEIEDLRREVSELRSGKTSAEQEAAIAVTRTRQQLGATQTSTSTGSMPVTPSEVQEQLAEVNGQIERAKRLRRGPDVMALNRRKAELEAELATAGR